MKAKLLFLSVLFLCIKADMSAQVAVIVNKSVPVGSINKAKLLDIYSISEKKWDNGQKIVVFDLKTEDSAKEKFYRYIGKSNAELKKTWMRVQLTGAGSAPQALYSDDEIVSRVASTPGAIGFVELKNVNGSVRVVAKIE
ncbi:MAG: hypothetical protein HF312_00015 [Ignavibacteria bacterium]|jgi:ABC-type phosphate transport system substrate-binding protein|nr:hypothetical protein [Ignavibacteria bacterium]MCU7505264.1 hypothetical protein [Ignavibacteria bacterium]MCU7518566.1 hypothetical protein [Ignavibacteria bacterium]